MNDKNDKNDIKKQVLLLFVVELCVCYWPGLEEECSSIPGIFVSRSLSRGGFGCVSLLSFEHG